MRILRPLMALALVLMAAFAHHLMDARAASDAPPVDAVTGAAPTPATQAPVVEASVPVEWVERSALGPFPNPPQLRDAVRFWRSIFSEYADHQVVLHDRANMDVVWEVLEVPRLDNGQVDEAAMRDVVDPAVQELSERLQRLQGGGAALDSTDEELLRVANFFHADMQGAHLRIRAQRGVANRFAEGMARAKQWVADVRQILREEQVPEHLVALPFVESMFNPEARSSAGAVGVWQLMPATARSLGLKVGGPHDERRDVLKATRAAARMLRQNYRILETWPLAITGYNHGPNGVRRAVQAVGSRDLVQLIEGYKRGSWGFASKNFYAEFLAVLTLLAESPEPDVRLALFDAAAGGDGAVQVD